MRWPSAHWEWVCVEENVANDICVERGFGGKKKLH